MILTILTIVLLFLSIIFLFLGVNSDNDNIRAWGISGLIVFGLLLVIELGFIIGVNIYKESDYQKYTNERNVLEYRLEHRDFEINDHKDLYADINNFNEIITKEKELSQNAWVSWFYNEKLGSIEVIDLSKK